MREGQQLRARSPPWPRADSTPNLVGSPTRFDQYHALAYPGTRTHRYRNTVDTFAERTLISQAPPALGKARGKRSHQAPAEHDPYNFVHAWRDEETKRDLLLAFEAMGNPRSRTDREVATHTAGQIDRERQSEIGRKSKIDEDRQKDR